MAVTQRLRRLLGGRVGVGERHAIEELANRTQATVISGSGATRTLRADETGALCLFDRAAGIVYSLPAPRVGLVYQFAYLTTVTSNAYTITAGAGVFLSGGLLSIDTDTANVTVGFVGNGTTHIQIASNGTTTGGLAGSRLRFECISPTRWLVSGSVLGTGVVATPFST